MGPKKKLNIREKQPMEKVTTLVQSIRKKFDEGYDRIFGKKKQKGKKVKELVLKRFCYHPKGTLGVIEVDGEKFYSIERPWLTTSQTSRVFQLVVTTWGGDSRPDLVRHGMSKKSKEGHTF